MDWCSNAYKERESQTLQCPLTCVCACPLLVINSATGRDTKATSFSARFLGRGVALGLEKAVGDLVVRNFALFEELRHGWCP